MRFRVYIVGLALAGASVWLVLAIGDKVSQKSDEPSKPSPNSDAVSVSQNPDEQHRQTISIPIPPGRVRSISQTVVIDSRGIVSATMTVER